MATFGEHFLLPFPKAHCLISGVQTITDGQDVLITHDQKYILIYNLSDQKVIKDWTFHNQVSCPAVCYGSPRTFATVIDHTVLRIWSEDQINVEKCKKVKVQSAVHCLWAAETSQEPYIIHSDGSCCSLSDHKVLLLESQINTKDAILWSGRVTGPDPVLVLVAKEDDHLTALVYHWTQDSVTCRKQKLLTEADCDTQDISSCQCASSVYLFLLRRSKRLDKFCVFSKQNEPLGSKQSSMVQDLTDCTAISVIDIHQVAVAGTHSSTGKSGLAIWNTRFGLLQTFHPTAKLLKHSKMHKNGKYLYLSTEDGPIGIPYIAGKTSLVSALGKLQKTSTPETDTTEKAYLSRVKKMRPILLDLIDSNKTPDKKKFNATFKKFSDCLNSSHTEDFFILTNEMSQLMRRLAQLTFWPGESIFNGLIQSKALQGNWLLTLMPLLLKFKEAKVLHRLLHSVPDVPEAALIQSLDFYLQSTTPTPAGPETDESTPSCLRNPYQEEGASYINKLLTLPYNDVFLIEQLRNMNFQQVMMLLRYLTYLLSETSSSPEIAKDKGLPSVEQVVMWLNVVLDAHFTQIILSPDCRDLAVDLHQIVESQVEFYEELVSLEDLLFQLRERSVVPAQQNVGLYCIQTLHVS